MNFILTYLVDTCPAALARTRPYFRILICSSLSFEQLPPWGHKQREGQQQRIRLLRMPRQHLWLHAVRHLCVRALQELLEPRELCQL